MRVAIPADMTSGATTPVSHLTCPACSAVVPALDGSSTVVAWYACGTCGALWSARIRGGHPTDPIAVDRRRFENEIDDLTFS